MSHKTTFFSIALCCAALLFPYPALAAASADTTSPGSQKSSFLPDPEALMAFLGTGLGRGLLVLCFFLFIVLVLRFLYGPKGKLRDPRWDELNREERQKDAEKTRQRSQRIAFQNRLKTLGPLLERETQVFQDYVGEFLSGDSERDAMFLLKQEHSLNVLEHAISIAAYETAFAKPEAASAKPISASGLGQASGPTGAIRPKPGPLQERIEQPDRVMLLAALYHDLGRFEQLKRFNTFRDADSVNHAQLSAELLRDRRLLSGESDTVRGQVRDAVLLHNRFALPAALRPSMRPICQAVRDADKLDIMRVMSRELAPGHPPDPTVLLGLADQPEKLTPEVLRCVLDSQQVIYGQMNYVNDFRLLLCSWLEQLTFNTSKRILARSGSLREIMAGLPDHDEITGLRARLNAELDSFL